MKQTLRKIGFLGGVKAAYDPVAIPDHALADALNIDPDDVGVLRLRLGSSEVAASPSNNPVQALHSAFGTLTMVQNQNLYKLASGSWTSIGATIGVDANKVVAPVSWALSGSEVLYLLGGNGIRRSDGSTTTLITPYTPVTGEKTNLLRAADGTQDTTSGIYKANIALLRPGLSNRMAVAYKNDVYLSAPDDPSYFPADQTFHLPDTGGEIVGLALWSGVLVIFRTTDVWAFVGKAVTDTSATLILQSSIGCVAGRTIATVPDVGLVYLGSDNIYALTAVAGVENRLEPKQIGNDIVPYIRQSLKSVNAYTVGFYHNNTYHLSIPSSTFTERVFRLKVFPELAWYVDSGPRTGYYAEWNDDLYCGSIVEGIVWKRTGLTDNGNAIPFFVTFKHDILSNGEAKYKKLFLFLANRSTVQHISMALVADGITLETVELALVGEASDSFKIGSSQIGVGVIGRHKRVVIYEGKVKGGTYGQFCQVRLSGSTPKEDIGIMGYAIEYRPKDRPEGKKSGTAK